jgi:polyhydroxyalkanoate synthesis repressor PhaR
MADDLPRLKIRKYRNRRYYDSTSRRHLTLDKIHAAIRHGHEIEVTDSKTGQDITAKILAQIIIELDPPKLGVFPVALLHKLLRANEQIVQGFTEKYFNQAVAAFAGSQRKFERSLRSATGFCGVTPSVGEMAKMLWRSFTPSKPSSPSPSPSPSSLPPKSQRRKPKRPRG